MIPMTVDGLGQRRVRRRADRLARSGGSTVVFKDLTDLEKRARSKGRGLLSENSPMRPSGCRAACPLTSDRLLPDSVARIRRARSAADRSPTLARAGASALDAGRSYSPAPALVDLSARRSVLAPRRSASLTRTIDAGNAGHWAAPDSSSRLREDQHRSAPAPP